MPGIYSFDLHTCNSLSLVSESQSGSAVNEQSSSEKQKQNNKKQ